MPLPFGRAGPQNCRLRGRVSEFLPVYKKAIAKLALRPAKHVRDRGHVPFAAPRRVNATLIEHVGN
jgi:hypothetical protein